MNRTIFAVALLVLSLASISATAKDKTPQRKIASTDQAVKVCGRLFVDQEGHKQLVVKETNFSYELIIDEVAAPKGLTKDLINYESTVYRKLKEGTNYCAIGILGMVQDTKYPIFNLTQFAIISEE